MDDQHEEIGNKPLLPGVQIRTLNIRKDYEAVTNQVLMPGDAVAYQVTHQVNYDNGEVMWVKFGTNSSKLEGESDQQAVDRVVGFVHASAAQAIKDAVQAARTITL